MKELFFLIWWFFWNIHLKLTYHIYLIIKICHFSQFITKMGCYCKILTYDRPILTKVSEQWLKVADSWLVDEDPYLWSVELKTIEFELMGGPGGGLGILECGIVTTQDHAFFFKVFSSCLNDLPGVRSADLEPIVYRANLWWHEPFPGETNIALKPCAGKAWVAKRSGWCLGIVPSKRCCQFSTISQILEENSPLTERRTSSTNHLFTLQGDACYSQGSHSNSAREILRALSLGVGWGGMSYWV